MVVKQKGGTFGVGMALGMAIPAVLGAAGKILPGIFGKKAKTTRTTNNNYNRPQLRARPRPPPQYYRPPPPQYYRPPPQYYQPPQYYRPPPQTQPQRYSQPLRRPPIKRLQKGSGIRPHRKTKNGVNVVCRIFCIVKI